MTTLQYVILGIILSIFPYLFELSTEGYRMKILKRRDKHGLTALIRWVFILAAGFGNPLTEFWWQGSLLAASLHWLMFNPSYNVWILEQRIDYTGKNLTDRIQKWITDKGVPLMAIYGFKVIVLFSAIKFYIDPYIY